MSQYATPFAAKLIDTPYDLSTKQGIFDHVATALIEQGMRSMVGNYCLYRGALGTKCAAGHLIPDGNYNPNIEGRSISTPYEIEVTLANHHGESQNHARRVLDALDPRIPRDGETIGFVKGLQTIHDQTDDIEWDSLPGKLQAFGVVHALDVSVISA